MEFVHEQVVRQIKREGKFDEVRKKALNSEELVEFIEKLKENMKSMADRMIADSPDVMSKDTMRVAIQKQMTANFGFQSDIRDNVQRLVTSSWIKDNFEPELSQKVAAAVGIEHVKKEEEEINVD